MATPLLITLAVAGPLVTVRPADVDGDGTSELVLASAQSVGAASPVVLETVKLGATAESSRSRVELPARPAWWDAGHGLWALDGKGLTELATGRKVWTGGVGLPVGVPSRAVQAGLVVDLDGNDQVELLVQTATELLVVGAQGEVWGRLPAAPEVELATEARAGGQLRTTTLRFPSIAVADVDGNGFDDILILGPRDVAVHASRAGGVDLVPSRWPLPAMLQPQGPDKPGEASEVTAVHWADLSGDGRADLLVHLLRSDGRLAGTEAEVHLFPSTESGLGAPQVVKTGAGSRDCFLVDFDNDGLVDVLLPQLSLDAGNLAKALISRSVDVELTLLPNEGGRLGEPGNVGHLTLPVEGSEVAWSLFDDLDGDGLVDLALVVDGRLRVYPGDGRKVATRPSQELDLKSRVTNLWAVDLTGDGAPELVGWAPGERRLAVVRLR